MKVLLISFSNNYDHQLSLYSLFDDLQKRGIDTYTIGITNPKLCGSFCKKNVFFDVPKKPGFSLKTFHIKTLKKIYNFINEQRFDVVYFESLHIWNVYLFKRLKGKTKIIHSIHDVIPHEGGLSFFIKKFNRIIFKYADVVTVRSKNAFDFCVSHKKIPNQKVRYVPLGRKWKEFNQCSFTNNVLFFGRITKYKGLDNLVKVCSDLSNINFYIVGKPIDKEDLKLIKVLKEKPNVVVCDEYVDEEKMIAFFSNCDCVILPYNSATQSGVVVDSYMMSRPCIAFKVGGISEQIIDGETGFLVDKDINLFENKINEYISSSKTFKNEMCKKAHEFGKRQYSSEFVAGMMLDIFIESQKEKL